MSRRRLLLASLLCLTSASSVAEVTRPTVPASVTPTDFIFNTLYGQAGLAGVVIGLVSVIVLYLYRRAAMLEARCTKLTDDRELLLREVMPLAKDATEALRGARATIEALATFIKDAHVANSTKIDGLSKDIQGLIALIQARLLERRQ